MQHWYVIHSKHQKESLLQEQLSLHNLEVYCPMLQMEGKSPRARKAWPYFPGYLFTHVDLADVSTSVLRWLPGAIGLVSFGGEPAYVPDTLLNTIRCRIEQINDTNRMLLQKTLKPGDKVMVHSGPFAGYEAIFCTQLRDTERVQVLLQLLQDHTVRVDLPVSCITAIKQNRP